jgi:hypothetical protein
VASVDQPFQSQEDQQNNSSNNGSQSTANSNIGQPPQLSSSTGNTGGSTGGVSNAQSGGNTTGTTPTAQTMAPQNPGGSQNSSQSGSFPNLSQYMSANSGWNASQGGLGGEIASNLNNQGNQVSQSVNAANNTFENQGNTWQQGVNTANNAFESGVPNASAYVQNDPNASQEANTALTANYSGPSSLNNANSGLNQQVQNYTSEAGQAQSAPGQYGLLQQMFGNSRYSQGQQNLDQALIQNSPQQMQALQGAASQANQANLNYQNAQTNSQNQAAGWGNFGNQVQQQATGALNNAVGVENNQIQNEFNTTQAAQNSAVNSLTAALGTNQLTQAQVDQLGIGSLLGQNVYNTNLASYITPQQLTAQNTANAGDYAQIAALQQLGGNGQAFTTPNAQTLAQYQNQPNQLYTSANDIGYNTAGAQTAVAANAEGYDQAVNAPIYGSATNAQEISRDLGNDPGQIAYYYQTLAGQNPSNSAQQLRQYYSSGNNNDPGMAQGFDALQNIINANNTFDPTAVLQLAGGPNLNTAQYEGYGAAP